ncbi:MAG: hypothetical protein CMM59_14935 [Rhodospirillaceae bacterium]|nr:hypothetical protein [Rhodospirillaceae bacterium]
MECFHNASEFITLAKTNSSKFDLLDESFIFDNYPKWVNTIKKHAIYCLLGIERIAILKSLYFLALVTALKNRLVKKGRRLSD